MEIEGKMVILFNSTNYAIWAQNELEKHKIENKMISVPRQLSSDCGYCVQINSAERTRAEIILSENKIDFDRFEDF